MKRLSQITCLLALFILMKGVTAHAQAEEARLLQTIQDAGAEETKAKQLEERAAIEREQTERRLKQVQSEITNQRYLMETYKARQEKAKQELDMLSVSTKDVDGKLEELQNERDSFEKNSTDAVQTLDSQRSQYTSQQKALDAEISSLSKARKRSERQIINKQMEVQALKANIDRLQATRAELESKTAETEADEMRVRTDWMQMKVQAAEHMKLRDEANARLADAKKRRDNAMSDMRAAQVELDKAAKERNVAMKTAESDIAKMEKEIQAAHKARINFESETIRVDAEVAKTREYVARMKESHEQALDQADTSEGLVWKSNLNLETARTELNHSVSEKDKENFAMAKEKSRARGMAAAAEANELIETAKAKRETASVVGQPDPPAMVRPYVLTAKCEAFEKPNKSLKPVGYLNEGQKVSGRQLKSGWVKLQNADGATVYVDGKCGKYEN